MCLVIYALENFSCASTTIVKQKRVGSAVLPIILPASVIIPFALIVIPLITPRKIAHDMRRCICKSTEYRAIDCPLSWYRHPATHQPYPPSEDNPAREDPDPEADPDPPADPPTPPAAGDVNLEPAPNQEIEIIASAISSDSNEIDISGTDPPVQGGPEDLLLDSQGFLVPQPSPHDLPEHPVTVAPSSQDSVLIEDLAMSDDASDDDIGETEGTSTTTEENLAASAQLLASAQVIQEALPLASALKRPKQQRKKIGRRGPAKLMFFFRKCTSSQTDLANDYLLWEEIFPVFSAFRSC